MKVSIKGVNISVGCDRNSDTADWDNEFIAFSSKRNIFLLRPETDDSAAQIESVNYFTYDQSCINTVKYVKNGKNYLVSGSCSGSVVVWKIVGNNIFPKYLLHKNGCCVLDVDDAKTPKLLIDEKMSFSVLRVAGLCLPDRNLFFVIACFDEAKSSNLRIWKAGCSSENFAFQVCACTLFETCSLYSCDLTPYNEGNMKVDVLVKLVLLLCILLGILVATGHTDWMIRIHFLPYDGEFQNTVLVLSSHKDWIESLHFSTVQDSSTFYLATGSLDKTVKVWKFYTTQQQIENDAEEGLFFKISTLLLLLFLTKMKNVMLSMMQPLLTMSKLYMVSNGVPGVYNKKLVSCSVDKSVIIWKYDMQLNCWCEEKVLGEVGGQAAGFYGVMFSPDGQSVMAHSFDGSLHCWKCDQENWKSVIMPSGHARKVRDVDWDSRGQYIVSCGNDKTTRLFGWWKRKGKKATFHELSRAQVHGYEMACLSVTRRGELVSGGEEKVLRVFNAPTSFVELLSSVCEVEHFLENEDRLVAGDRAIMPALGLSNISISDDNDDKYNIKFKNGTMDNLLVEPLLATDLAQNTLWIEVHKLYGHGFELHTVASNHAGSFVASACLATCEAHAKIFLWSTVDWRLKTSLEGHKLTVTRICFSHDDKMILSASRDRSWCLFSRQSDGGEFDWQLIAQRREHARIIWDCAWAPDDKSFVTASRDKKLMMWNMKESTADIDHHVIVLEDSVTAVDIFSKEFENRLIVVAGLNNGNIYGIEWNRKSGEHQFIFNMTQFNSSHSSTVSRLKFSPLIEQSENGELPTQLASCSFDHSLRIYNLNVISN
ncbi:Elongator complex protein 2 [Trichinella pseudospiralis]|uniref:Elongator complex protein 2 n=1 Tax=Trichinella pseudospiralis TaxID=6337 RepID=A0A0V1IZD7_TRIPS|nr:Elongator complex protein 2 [Trichinella pseudospiralis]